MTKKFNKINQANQIGNVGFDKTNKKNYFACSNTCLGFINLFNIIFSSEKLEKIYIIKDCGGLSFLNEISRKAEEKKYSAEHFLCPVDMNRLNGIIIKELKTAVINENLNMQGNYPVILENIVNFNDFFDEAKLTKQKKAIFNLIKQKNEYYKLAYKFLRAANELAENITELSEKYINHEKLASFVERIAENRVNEKHLHDSKDSECYDEYKFINSVSADGLTELDTFELNSKKIFYVSNENFSGWRFMDYILKKLENSCKVLCPDALNPNKIKTVFLKKSQILFIIKEKDTNKIYSDKYSFINMERFIDKNFKKNNKQKLRFIQKCYKSILSEAVKYFSEIKDLNKNIENIYESAVKINEKNKYTDIIIKRIFS